ncbi:MAG: peptidylprolyl isomerase [Alphaproteobacteria bacterium]
MAAAITATVALIGLGISQGVGRKPTQSAAAKPAVPANPPPAATNAAGKVVAKAGDNVRVEYTGTLDDGTVFDSNVGATSLDFTLGRGRVIPGFDAAVTGMAAGETRKVHIPAADAYGPRDEALVHKVERSKIPTDTKLEPGALLQAQDAAGNKRVVKVVSIDGTMVTLDENHLLAGKDLNFDIKLLSVN